MLRAAILKNGWTSARAATNRLSVAGSAPSRAKSSYAYNGLAGGTMGKVFLGATVVGVGTLGYARIDAGFAKTLKDAVPAIEPVLTALGCDTTGGSIASSSKGKPAPVKGTSSEQSSLLKSKPKVETPKDQELKKSARSDDTVKSASATAGDSTKERELRRQKQNFILEQALRDAGTNAERAAVEASSELDIAAERTEDYATKLTRALDEAAGSDDHHMWVAANEAKESQSASQKKANSKMADANKALLRLEETIHKGRADPTTTDNINLDQAERNLTKLREKIDGASARADESLKKLNLAQKFSAGIEEGKKQLIEEVNALLPQDRSFADLNKLTPEDLNVLIYHAHKKIQSLHLELTRMQLSDDEKAKQFRQQLSALDKEIGRQKSEVAKLVAEKVSEEREQFELELQNQLRRQVGVHTEHLKEALEDQRAELFRKHQFDTEKAREEERSLQVARLAEAVDLLQKMEAYLNARKLLDEASKKAKSLWLSCASLKHILAKGITEKQNTPQPLAADIVPLREVSESSEFVKVVLSTIPDEALKRGVYPEVVLKERFYKVETACRRLALMEDQNGGGPGRHLLSYLMSFFMIYPKAVPQEELDKEQKVNPLMWDTLDILSRVRASLQKEDLEQALRYANQLKGQPRQAAKDWIHELRLLLETRQAASALMAYAAATFAQDQPNQ
ncbi:MICOS complex subunit MIC60-1-like [Varroa jacobsoni]|uniref:MICOS complex subunit MIC60 n=1 Tax=Varroa destructor TaxID=109461 RepID=A0A7M7KU15_VARDE|nr:MICOS complex subunit MIC60-1-like isoform X2 [Varroa destructor]XP_022687935.1 MICOS complex subunit MIC60-1-like [Varroa jacobsoni]